MASVTLCNLKGYLLFFSHNSSIDNFFFCLRSIVQCSTQVGQAVTFLSSKLGVYLFLYGLDVYFISISVTASLSLATSGYVGAISLEDCKINFSLPNRFLYFISIFLVEPSNSNYCFRSLCSY